MAAGLRTAVLTLLLTAVLAAPAAADVYAPGSSPFGKTYGEWNAQWWTTMGQTTAGPGHPFASGDVKCSGVNDGRVILLAGTTGGTATRSCRIPASKALLVPLLNFVCWDGSEQELRDCAASATLNVASLTATLDGVPLAADLTSFRAPSALFTLTLVAGNTLGFPELAPSPAVADGYYVMVKPLTRGSHTLSFGGSTLSGFSTLATYDLTVVK